MSSFGKIYIAVVDDEESLRRSMSRLLRAAGFQAVAYASAEAFLDDGKRLDFDCLVLDVRMEGMSGIDLQRHLARTGSTVPIVFITAHDDPELREQALAAGCAGFFRKTDSGRAVIAAIKTATERP